MTEAGDVAVIAKMWPTFGGPSPQNRSSSAVHLPLNSQGFFLDLRAQDPQHPDAQSLCTFPSPARGKIERHVALLLPVRRRMVPRGSDLPSPPSNGNSAIQLSAPSMCAYAHEPWLPHHFFLHSIEGTSIEAPIFRHQKHIKKNTGSQIWKAFLKKSAVFCVFFSGEPAVLFRFFWFEKRGGRTGSHECKGGGCKQKTAGTNERRNQKGGIG